MTNNQLTDKRLEEIKDMATDAGFCYGKEWDSALVANGKMAYHALTSDFTENVVVYGIDDSLEASWLCDYLAALSPACVLALITELQERRKAVIDSEPVRNPVLAYADSYRDMAKQGVESVPIWSVITGLERNIAPLYRHAQQPVVQKIMARLAYLLDEDQFHNIESMVLAAATQPAAAVPDDVLDALQKVARIRLDMNDFDGDRRGIADCLGDAEEALIEVVNRRAVMLQGAKNTESRCGIQTAPALDSFKENADARCGNSPVIPEGYVMVPMRLTAENGAKGALSGEFSETKFINCPECFGDDECETCDGSGRIEITVPVTWTTIKEIWAKGVEHFAAAPQEVK